MKARLTGLVVVALLGLVAAAPASAARQKPLNGDMELTLFAQPCAEPHVPPFLSWAGTTVLDGTEYGIAYFPTTPPPVPGEKFFYFEEAWTLFTLDESGVTPETACDVDRVVVNGFDSGRGGPGGTFKADGTVTHSDVAGIAEGSRALFRGRYANEAGTQFESTLHIFPPK